MERYLSTFLSKKGRVGSFLELTRPWNGTVMFMMALIGILFVSVPVGLASALLASASFLIIYMAGTTLNDIFDFKIDKINMPYRPLQSGRMNIRNACIISCILYFISFFIAYFLSFKFFVVILSFGVLSLLYSSPPLLLSRRSLLGNLSLAVVSILIPAYGGAVLSLNSFIVPQIFLYNFISLTLLFSFVVIVKDFKDIEGDKKSNKITFAVHIGKKNALLISIIGAVIFFVISVFLFGKIYQNILFYIISAVILFLMAIVYDKFRKSTTASEDEKYFGLIRVVMILFIILILIFSAIKP